MRIMVNVKFLAIEDEKVIGLIISSYCENMMSI